MVPVVLQDADSGDVLFIGYANEEAYRETLARGSAVLYSTSREQIWHKGATSGDVLDLVEVAVNCEQNSLIYKVRKAGTGVCHTKDEAARPVRPVTTGRSRTPRRSASPDADPPRFRRVRRLAADHTVVPVWAEVLADLTTPVAAFARVVGDDEDSARVGRQRRPVESVVVHRSTPQGTLVSKDGRLQVIGDLGIDIDPEEGMLTAARASAAHYRSPELDDLPPLHGGLIGYLGYDVVREVEHLPNVPADDLGHPDAVISMIGELAVYDHGDSGSPCSPTSSSTTTPICRPPTTRRSPRSISSPMTVPEPSTNH